MHSAFLNVLFLLSMVCPRVQPTSASAFTKPSCQRTCGKLEIPYPFGIGIGSNCSISSPWFDIRCREGYEGNPHLAPGCHDIDECNNYPCHSNGICYNTPGSYNCSCHDGYSGDGKRNGSGCFQVPGSKNKVAIGVGLGSGMGLILLLSTCFWLKMFVKDGLVVRESGGGDGRGGCGGDDSGSEMGHRSGGGLVVQSSGGCVYGRNAVVVVVWCGGTINVIRSGVSSRGDSRNRQ
ncbi:unnamed protein product [Fraxinus pennsylvanica]|uniref:EGF-like calcium-binding domain-containing protein n=1 Tax=Fraxinus pennsylvanica TaxID=56036 RepID=A0AAD1ZCY0_9LAMI|nr:unnamed protein product [Fraxinus pennsylvanica]